MSTKLDNIPVGAVVAGHSEDNGHERLYVGRARYFDHIIPGKVQPSHKVCYIAFDGKEISVENYEILVVPDKSRSSNKFLLPPIDMNIMVESEDENDDIDDHSMNYDNYDGFYYADP